jgi:Zn-dependent protease
VAALAAAGAFVAKFGALLLKIKYLGLVLSMVLSVLAYTLLWGWTFAVGFVLLMFVHEMGHVIVLKRQGIRASLPLFIPFLGAFVSMKEMPRSAYQEALSGLAGPYFGVAGSVVVAFWGHAIGSNFLLQLAAVGFLLNLFNLMPALPLDGGRAVGALHPVIWFFGLVGLLVYFFFTHAPIVLIILLLGGFELYRRWTRRNSPSSVAYNTLKPQQRWAIGSLYVLIVAAALVGFELTYVSRSL